MLEADLYALSRSRLVLVWIVAAIFIGVISVLGSQSTPAPVTITSNLSHFISIWSLIIIGLTGGAITSEAGEVADSLLSKSVTRHEYVLAKLISRILVILPIFFSISGLLIGLTYRFSPGGIDGYGLSYALLTVALLLVMLISLGIMLSSILPNTVVSIIVLLVIWYSMVFFLPLAGVEELEPVSPSYLLSELPSVISGIWGGDEWRTALGFGLMTTLFSTISLLYFSRKDL